MTNINQIEVEGKVYDIEDSEARENKTDKKPDGENNLIENNKINQIYLPVSEIVQAVINELPNGDEVSY